jgi:hypothetical protein
MSGAFSTLYQIEQQPSSTQNITQTETTQQELPNTTDIDFSIIKYFKKIDHNGKIIQYLKNEIVAYRDRLYYATEDVSSLYEPFEKSAVWNELKNIPNRKISSISRPTGYFRSGDIWHNPTTGKTYMFQNINNYPFWISS